MEIEEKNEGQKINGNLDGTSTSVPEANKINPDLNNPDLSSPDLNSTPQPTAEQIADAGLTDTADVNENVDSAVGALDGAPAQEEQGLEGSNEPAPAPVQPEMHEENGVFEAPSKTFTQSQVDDIAGRTRLETREKTFRYIYDRYGVKDESELDNLIGNAQRYDTLNEQYENEKRSWQEADMNRNNELAEVKERIALMESGIDKERYEDAKLILKGKGLEINAENIANELNTHPEWKKQEPAPVPAPLVPPEPESQISVLGNEVQPSGDQMSEEDFAMKHLFKL